MNYVLGIDGGGTKTAFSLCDERGHIVSTAVGPGCSYKQHGTVAVLHTLLSCATQCSEQAHIALSDITGACVGLPCFGEDPSQDAVFAQQLREMFFQFPLHLVNDAEVAWAGSLAAQAGVNIVAGTGSIAFGVDDAQNSARCGGWSWVFGDEGSCHWVGMKTMELFSKEADGREPKGALYKILHEELQLSNDMQFTALMEQDYCPYREKTASLQLFLCRAAQLGDEAAREIYRAAARELAMIVKGVTNSLSFDKPVRVSYSGGIFRAGALILEPFTALLPAPQYELCSPQFSPVEGAVLLAFHIFLPQFETAALQSFTAAHP